MIAIKKRKVDPSPHNVAENGVDTKNVASKKIKVKNNFVKNAESPTVAISTEEVLPIAAGREKFINELRQNDTIMLVGETGCGKTTQIPKYIYEAGLLFRRKVGVTQPRRVAAVSVAKRVSEEMGTELGELVGYSVRFDDTTSESTRIKYMTDGMLLREAMRDELLKNYSCIILDEAHERTIHMDVLFGVLREAQEKRKDLKRKARLKLVIMSATMDVDHLKTYFNNCKVLYVEGRTFPVEVFHIEQKDDDYCTNVICTILQLHKSLPTSEHILAFLTGQDEIESIVKFFRSQSFDELPPLEVYPLYAALPDARQLQAISKPLPTVRRIIVSTNIAETSITIPGVRVVIDSGKVKCRFFVGGASLDILRVVSISQAQALQRTGRAGRQTEGKCYRMYTEEAFKSMELFTVPEIMRCSVSGVFLHLLKIGFNKPISFSWIDPPPEQTSLSAVQELKDLGAITSIEEPLELTPSGSLMALLPLDPVFAKILITGPKYFVLEPVLTIISILSSEHIFENGEGNKISVRDQFSCPEGDLISYLQVYREFKKSKNKSSWCKVHKVSLRALKYASDVRKQLLEVCQQEEIKSAREVFGEEMRENVRKCFYECLQHNRARYVKGNLYKVKRADSATLQVRIHPSSVLYRSKPPFVLFTEVVQSTAADMTEEGTNYMRHLSLIEPHW